MNNEIIKESKGIEISIATLWSVFVKFIWIVCIATVVAGALLVGYTSFFTKTKYSATVRFNVVNILPDNPYIADTMITAASSIAGIYVEAAQDNVPVSAAVKHGKLDDYFGLSEKDTIDKVAKMISAKKDSPESTIFSITVTSANKDDVLKVITAVQEVTPDTLTDMNIVPNGYEGETKVTTTARPVSLINGPEDIVTINPSVIRNGIIGALVGFCVSYLVCFIIYINDTKVYDDATIKKSFESPVIGIIPTWIAPGEDKKTINKCKNNNNVERKYIEKIINEKTPFAVTEAFNTLRTNLCYATVESKCPVFAVTSDISGVGKSVVSVNIALSMAMLGKKALVIECDLRRPKFNMVFNTNVSEGLAEVLSGMTPDYKAVIKKYGEYNLNVIFAGHTPPNPNELLGSEKMAKLVAELKEIYDIIIIDTPPAFEVSDVCVLSPILDGNIIVARSQHSNVNSLKTSIEAIHAVSGKIVGFVVNDIDPKQHGYEKNYEYYTKA